MQPASENFIRASDQIMSKLKDLEGINAGDYK